MSAVERSEDATVVLAKPPAQPPTPWIAAASHRLRLQLCTVHEWAVSFDVVESVSLYHIATAALGQMLVLAWSFARSFVERAIRAP